MPFVDPGSPVLTTDESGCAECGLTRLEHPAADTADREWIEALRNVEGFLALDPDREVERAAVEDAIESIRFSLHECREEALR